MIYNLLYETKKTGVGKIYKAHKKLKFFNIFDLKAKGKERKPERKWITYQRKRFGKRSKYSAKRKEKAVNLKTYFL